MTDSEVSPQVLFLGGVVFILLLFLGETANSLKSLETDVCVYFILPFLPPCFPPFFPVLEPEQANVLSNSPYLPGSAGVRKTKCDAKCPDDKVDRPPRSSCNELFPSSLPRFLPCSD